MTNTEMMKKATREFVGKVLTAKQIIAVTLAMFPTAKQGSILPSDHAGANSKGNVYADQLFLRVATGYKVLPDAEIVAKPKTARTRETLQDALVSARALLAVTPASGKPNGKPATN
ncbi:MAG TPA: hypothetical protein VN843_35010 [Anaerolineales bacterium]|nr:hypothetical protein [Anaerolineales bacterium]